MELASIRQTNVATWGFFPRAGLLACGLMLCGSLLVAPAASQSPGEPKVVTREVVIEVYFTPGQERDERCLERAREFAASRVGVQLAIKPLPDHPKNAERFRNLARAYRFSERCTPVIFGCGRVLHSLPRDEDVLTELNRMLRIEIYTRPGCSRCNQAKTFLSGLLPTYPAIELVECDITREPRGCSDLMGLVTKFNQAASSVPVFHLCNQLFVGFDRPEGTGARLKQVLDKWTVEKKVAPTPPEVGVTPPF